MKLFRALSVPLSMLILAGAMMYSKADTATATHTPANKVAASGSTREITWVTPRQPELLLSETIRTSKPTDLILNVSAECSILNTLSVTGNDTASADGAVTIRVMIKDANGVETDVPVTSEPVGGRGGEVVFCNQAYSYTQRVTNSDDDEDDKSDKVDTYLRTRQANSFQWLALNVGSGVITINVYADYTEAEVPDGTAQGAVGSRTLVIEPVKSANDEVVTELSER